jgi:rubrerythrin
MSDESQVCYTFEAALEMAIQMETERFRSYLDAIRRVRNKAARQILKDAAIDQLDHKCFLEKALIEGQFQGATLAEKVPTMNLDYSLAHKDLSADSTPREALAYAIHLENGSIDFYRRMVTGCEGAPMAPVFAQLLTKQTHHLQEMEDLYEQHFLPEN